MAPRVNSELRATSIDAPAITLPQPAYDPSQTASISPVPYSLHPASQTSLPPAYIQKSPEQSEGVSRQDESVTGAGTQGELPAYR